MRVLALDAGTTGVTALVLDDWRIVGRAYQEITQHYPRRGWVEHDAMEILETTVAVGRRALAAAHVDVPDAVGITNQRETTVVWDRRTGMPVHPALVWQDRRTAAACRDLASQADLVRARTGLVIDPYFSATKVAWILDHLEARGRAGLAFGTVDAWLAAQLTGRHVTDVTNASRTLLYDIHADAWDADLLDLFSVPETMLPEVVPSAHVIGPVAAFGGAPLAALVGDQQAALYGQRCFGAGEAKATYGTGAFLLQHTGTSPVTSQHGLLTTRAASPDATRRYALEGSVFVAGAALQWLRDGLHLIASAPQADELADGTDADGVTLVPAFTGLGAPHWDPDARGAVFGLTRGTDRRHLARAAIESIAFQTYDVVTAMEADSGVRMPALRVDGGAARSRPLLQFQADLLQRPVVRPADLETTALGAGMLAAIAIDAVREDDLRRLAGDTRCEPRMADVDRDAHLQRWRSAVAATRAYRA